MALASHQCGPRSIPGPGVLCGLSLLLILERTNTFKRTSELLNVSWENKSHNHTEGILSYFLFQIPLLVPHLQENLA